ncbi:cobalamin biosynthesis protein [Ensifer soli]|uniref:cobalamin biosynthesis protein n=1 Tax=Ciceribacter sp. sgz301302 TaxID=3342379 RepID=UPI0035BADFA6
MPESGPCVFLGLGCERNTPAAEIIALAEAALARAGVLGARIGCIASLDRRANEPAVIDAARHFAVALRTFDAATLEALTPRLLNPSDIVFAHTGCHGVAEAAALAAAGPDGWLAVPKLRSARATAAIAVVAAPHNGAFA